MAGWSGRRQYSRDDAEQADIWGSTTPVLARERGQQLQLFTGQGPGATMRLPDGSAVASHVPGVVQATLDLAGAVEQPPADSWPDPDEIADCEGTAAADTAADTAD